MARVLVISADYNMSSFLEHILQTAGYSISLAENHLGTEMFSQTSVNAILVDLSMPGAAAPSFVAALRSGFPDVPILLIAGENQTLDFLEMRLSGADDVLKKPFSQSTLLEAMARAMEDAPR